MTADAYELFGLVVVVACVGAFSGVIAGLLGVGGGIVIVPALFYVFRALEFPQESLMHVAVATSLATIILTSARSVMSHHKRGAVDWDLLRAWAPWIAIGSVLGVVVADFLNTSMLAAVFGGVALIVAAHMARASLGDKSDGALGATPPEGAPRVGWAFGTGLFSALMGIGGGTLGVPLLSLYSVPIHRAVATAAGFGLIIAVPSVIGFVISGWDVSAKPPGTIGYVNMIGFAIITPMTVLCAPVGVRLAHALDARMLRLAFAAFLGLTSVNMLREALLGG